MFHKRDDSIQAKPGDGRPSDASTPSTTPPPARSLPGETAWHPRSGPTGETVIGSGMYVRGRLMSEDTIRVRGTVEGELTSAETILVEPAGHVTATIAATQVVIAGQVDGHVQGKGRIELRSTARVRGELHTPVLMIQEGAAFDGRVRMTGHLAQGQPLTTSMGAPPSRTGDPTVA